VSAPTISAREAAAVYRQLQRSVAVANQLAREARLSPDSRRYEQLDAFVVESERLSDLLFTRWVDR
jgi:hypothetical protein